MGRRIFISHQHDDRMKAKGFNLLRWNHNVDLEFVGRHLLDPVDSDNDAYIRQKVREQLNGTSVTVVLVGTKTCESDWVCWEVATSVERGNGVLAICLDDGTGVVPGSPLGTALRECGAEVMPWEPNHFGEAIERAAVAAGRAAAIKAGKGSGSGTCSR
jgi:hypothetical protein